MKRIREIEGLRAVMALWVMLFHIAAFAGVPLAGRLMPGAPVDVFIIISGFVIALLINTRSESYSTYLSRRFMRLYPILFIAVVLAVMLQGVYHEVIFSSPVSDRLVAQQERLAVTSPQFEWHVLLTLLMAQGAMPNEILDGAGMAVLSPAWSISLEWQFYLVAPLIVPLFRRLNLAVLASLGGLALYFALRHSGLTFDKPSFLPLRLPLFMLGIMTFHLYASGVKSRAYLIHACGYGAVCLVAMKTPSVLIWAAFLVLLFATGNGVLERLRLKALEVMSSKWPVTLGEISYSMYILHVPIIWVMIYALAAAGITSAPAMFAACLILVPPIVVGVSLLTYRYIEKPLSKFHLGGKTSARTADRNAAQMQGRGLS